MTRTLILIRHAHRDTTRREADNGLSEKGARQAAALLHYFVKVFGAETTGAITKEMRPRIVSSPKKRCVETVAGIAREAGVRVEQDSALLEQQPGEEAATLRRRAERFVEKWRAQPQGAAVTIACSHGDWLPAALQAACGARAELKKGSWAEVRVEDGGKPRLEWLIQTFKGR